MTFGEMCGLAERKCNSWPILNFQFSLSNSQFFGAVRSDWVDSQAGIAN
jgi:hypothetical protein